MEKKYFRRRIWGRVVAWSVIWLGFGGWVVPGFVRGEGSAKSAPKAASGVGKGAKGSATASKPAKTAGAGSSDSSVKEKKAVSGKGSVKRKGGKSEDLVVRGREILEKVLEAHGGEKRLRLVKSLSYHQKMRISTEEGDVSIEGTVYYQAPSRVYLKLSLLGVPIEEGFDGKRAWIKRFGKVEEVPKQQFRHFQEIVQGIRNQLLYPYKDRKVVFSGKGKHGSGEVYRLRIEFGDREVWLYIRPKDFYLVRREERFLKKSGPRLAVEYSDPRREGDLVFYGRLVFYRGKEKVGVAQNSKFLFDASEIEKVFQSSFPRQGKSEKKSGAGKGGVMKVSGGEKKAGKKKKKKE